MNPIEGEAPPALLGQLAPYRAYLSVAIFRNDWLGKIIDGVWPEDGPIGGIGTESLASIHPNDVMVALEAIFTARTGGLGTQANWTARYKMLNGEYREFSCQITNCHEDPSVASMLTVMAPTARRDDEQSGPTEEGSSSGVETLTNAIPLPVFFFGPGGLLRFSNESAHLFFRNRLEDISAGGLAAICRGEDRPKVVETVQRLLSHPGREIISFSVDDDRATHSSLHLEAHLHSPAINDRVIGLVATLIDVTHRVEAEAALRSRAARDPLTGLLHRGEIEAALAARLADEPASVSVLYIDLDDFKHVNDEFGHETGDDLLVAVAQTLTANARQGDLVGRLGGDEFIIVLGAIEERDDSLAARLKQAIVDRGNGHGYRLDSSIGAAIGEVGDAARDLIRRADRAMYEVKRGRSGAPPSLPPLS